MRIYFEDGNLKRINELPITPDFIVNAADGVTDNTHVLDSIYNSNPNSIVYTNSIFAFSNRYAWNETLRNPEVYIRAGKNMEFTRIDSLTDRALRECHSLAKLYITGEFMDC